MNKDIKEPHMMLYGPRHKNYDWKNKKTKEDIILEESKEDKKDENKLNDTITLK